MPRLAVTELSAGFDDVVLFSGLSFEVEPGEAVAVVGPSGSGKSTLLACLAGIARPLTGSIRIVQTELVGAPQRERDRVRADGIGQVFQDPALLEELTVRENVELPLRFAGKPPEAAATRAQEALSGVGIDHLSGRWIDSLSGGEAQRVAVARALATGSRVLLADEPTAALDRASADLVADALITAIRHLGTAAVIATHDLTVAARCDRILDVADVAPRA